MLTVLVALAPGAVVQTLVYGAGVPIVIALSVATALVTEALMLSWRARPVAPFLRDGSALVTGVLLGLALPPLAPWWLPVTGAALALAGAKHLYGGLGYNPFNPAMAGYALLIIAFPREMTQWVAPGDGPGLAAALSYTFAGHLPDGSGIDAITSATPLDWVRTEIARGRTLEAISGARAFGAIAGRGTELVNIAFLAGGLWLLARRTITWQIPAGFLLALAVPAAIAHFLDPSHHVPASFHLFGGAAMLGAFFIATDPVTSCASPAGRLVFGAGIGVLVWLIRAYGGYPDAVAFAVLLMNMTVPAIDRLSRPRVYGRR